MWVCFHLHISGLKICKIVRPKRGLALFRRMRSEVYLRKRRMTVTLEVRSVEARRMRSEAYLRKRRMTVMLKVRSVKARRMRSGAYLRK